MPGLSDRHPDRFQSSPTSAQLRTARKFARNYTPAKWRRAIIDRRRSSWLRLECQLGRLWIRSVDCLIETSPQLFGQGADVRRLDNVDVIAGNHMRFNFPLYQLTPAIVQIVLRREITGEKERHVTRIAPRHIILHGRKVNLFDVLQHWRQRSADLFVNLVSAAIEFVFG